MDQPREPIRWWETAERPFKIVAIAASAGGLSAVGQVLAGLPATFPVPILLLQHFAADALDVRPTLWSRRTALRVKFAQSGEVPQRGTVFVAPGGRHMTVLPNGTLSLSRAGRIRYVCPSADLLFESVARYYREQAIVVVLTGMGIDGAEGIKAMRECGGYVIAQDAATSEHFDMPYAAIETRRVDLVLPLQHIAFALTTLTSPPTATMPVPSPS